MRLPSPESCENSLRLRLQQPRVLRSASESSLVRSKGPTLRVSTSLPRVAGSAAASPPVGVSAAFLVSFSVENAPPTGSSVERRSTRGVAAAMRRRIREEGEEAVPGAASLAASQELHPLTSGPLAGPASVHVAHAWDADFSDLVDCVFRDASSDIDRRYSLDIFGAEHLAPPEAAGGQKDTSSGCQLATLRPLVANASGAAGSEDSVAAVKALVDGAKEVLVILDSQGKALSRLWILFEAMLALPGKLRVRSAGQAGFGNSREALLRWEALIDGVDWALADATRKNDVRRMRTFAERVWETQGCGIERLTAQLKVQLRREIYNQILLGAVEAGDRKAVEAALEKGANPDQKADGNTLEELASFNGHQAIEDLLFERRMRGLSHEKLSMFFKPKEMLANSDEAHPDVLMPFMTEPFLGDEGSEDGDADSQDWQFLAGLDRLSEQSTHTPGSSQMDWRSSQGVESH
ncbi:unnamed protein product [Polarella glacialis]|uniref:Uncharacterized protein n=1 Tax=Polarella glacialis TaxID=89957 RepID=A0A813F4J5_POLGL|nr:unnamed protein product [Polarella glacialis]